MKIEPSSYQFAARQNSAPRGADSSDVKGTVEPVQQVTAAGEQNSTVNLSSMSALCPSGDSDIDTTKVGSVKAALRDGSYAINSGKIADGLLGAAGELLQQ